MSEHELWNELGNLYFMSGAYRQASHAYERSIKLENRSGRPHSNLAFTYIQQGKNVEAVELLRASIDLLTCDREKAISWYRLGDVYRRLKDYRDAILAYQQADLLDPTISQNEEEVGQVLYGSSELVSAPELDQRAALEEQTIVVEPPASDSPILDSPTLSDIAPPADPDPGPDLTVVEELAVQAVELEVVPEPPNSTLEIQEDFSDSEIEPVLETEAAEPLDWLFLSETPIAEESQPQPEFGDHLEDEQTLVEPLPPVFPAILQGVAFLPAPSAATQTDTLFRTDFRNVAVAEADVPLQVEFVVSEEQLDLSAPAGSPEDELELASPTTMEESNPQPNEIGLEIEKFQRMLDDDPRNAAAWVAFGDFYKSVKMYKDAISAYQQALSIDPKNVHYLHCLGITYAVEGCVEDAIRILQEVLQISPGHALAHATLSGYYKKMGMEELAQKHIGKAMKNFFDTENEYNRACLQALCGKSDEAISLLRIALEKKQTYADWVMRDPDLDTIRQDPRFKQLIADFI